MKHSDNRIFYVIGLGEIVAILFLFPAVRHLSHQLPDTACLFLFITGTVASVLVCILIINKHMLRSERLIGEEFSHMRFKDEILHEIVEAQTVGTMVTDAKTAEILMVNRMAFELFHVDQDLEHLTVMDFRCKFDEEGDKFFVTQLMELRKGKGEVEFEQPVYPYEGACIHILVNAKRVILSNGDNVIIYCFMDISDRKKLEEELIGLSETDYLTAIRNRRSGESRTEEVVESGGQGMFCLFDVDKFKRINDTFGHTAGDRVLIAIAEAMKKSFRSSDVLIRLGGDEFAVFASGVLDRKTGKALINRFMENISDIGIEGLDGLQVSISLGAILIQEKMTFADMYTRADSLMYDCKSREGNAFAFYADPRS